MLNIFYYYQGCNIINVFTDVKCVKCVTDVTDVKCGALLINLMHAYNVFLSDPQFLNSSACNTKYL